MSGPGHRDRSLTVPQDFRRRGFSRPAAGIGFAAAVLVLFRGAEPGIPLDTVDKMKAALNQGSPTAQRSEFMVFPDDLEPVFLPRERPPEHRR